VSAASDKRQARDDDILRLFIAGATYRQIGRALNTSIATVSRVVVKKLAEGQTRRDLLSDQALSVHTERTERLFQAHWQKALAGDHRSAEICRRILAQQERTREAAWGAAALPAPTQTLTEGDDDVAGFNDEPQDDLSKLRAARGAN
jgi:hypothetical protein